MAKEHDHLLIAYMPDHETAEQAAQDLKEWENSYSTIRLGAMGIISRKEDGQIKTEKIGSRATSEGAKWGVLAGAVAGIFTGGIGLVGGALVGLAAGTIAGTMFHRGLGMSDEEKENLDQHLAGGGVALAVMVNESEAHAAESILAAICDEVNSCQLDPETLAHLQESSSSSEI